MAGTVLEARAVIRGQDDTKAAFESVKARIAGLQQHITIMERAFGSVGKVAPSVEAVHISTGRAAGDLSRFMAATSAVGEASRNTQRSTMSLTEALQREMQAVKMASAALAEAGMPTGRLVAEQERLAGIISSTTAAIERQTAAEGASIATSRRAGEIAARVAQQEERAVHARREAAQRGGVGHLIAGSMAGYVAAHSILGGVEESMKAGAAYQHERVGLVNAGRTPEEIKSIEDASAATVSKVPTATYLENMKVVAETTSAFGSVEHATDNLEFMQKTMSVLHAAAGDKIQGGPGEVGRALAKTFEERLTKPENFQSEASQMVPAMVASGGVFNPEELYKFAQQAGSSLPNYGMHFLSRIAPSMITMMGGERAGTAANAWNSIIMGKVNDKKQAEAWLNAGLLDPSKVIMKAGHAVGWSAGAVKNTDLALTDPLAWSEQVQIPALQKQGVDMSNRLDVAKQLGTMYRNQKANIFATDITQEGSRSRLHKDEHLYGQVGSLDDIYDRNLKADPTVAMKAFQASLENLMTTIASPAMARAGTVLNEMAAGLASMSTKLAQFEKDHPQLAPAIGPAVGAVALGSAGVLSGMVVKGSARALGRAMGIGGKAAEIGEAAGIGEAGAALGGVSLLPLLAGGALAGGSIYGLSHYGVKGASGGRFQPPSIRKTDGPGHYVIGRGGVREWVRDPGVHVLEGVPEFPNTYPNDFTLNHFDHDLSLEPPSKTAVGSFGGMPRVRGAADGGSFIGGSTAPTMVSLDPNSKASVEITIKVDPSSELLRAIVAAQSASSSGNVQASVGGIGTSSPTRAVRNPGIGRM